MPFEGSLALATGYRDAVIHQQRATEQIAHLHEIQAEKQYLQVAFVETQQKCSDKGAKLEKLQASMGALERRHRQLELQLAEITFESQEKDKMLESVETQLVDSERQNQRCQSEAIAAHVAVAKKDGELSAIRDRLADVQESHNAADAAASKAQTAGAEKAIDVISLEHKVNALESKNKELKLQLLDSKTTKVQMHRELNAIKQDLITSDQTRKQCTNKLLLIQNELANKQGENKCLLQQLADDKAKKIDLETALMKYKIDHAKSQKEMVNVQQRCDTLLADKVATQAALSRLQAAFSRKDKEANLLKNRLVQEQENKQNAKIAADQSRRAEIAANRKFENLCAQLEHSETQRERAYSTASQAIADNAQRKSELEATQQILHEVRASREQAEHSALEAQVQALATKKTLSATRTKLVEANTFKHDKVVVDSALNEALLVNADQQTSLEAAQQKLDKMREQKRLAELKWLVASSSTMPSNLGVLQTMRTPKEYENCCTERDKESVNVRVTDSGASVPHVSLSETDPRNKSFFKQAISDIAIFSGYLDILSSLGWTSQYCEINNRRLYQYTDDRKIQLLSRTNLVETELYLPTIESCQWIASARHSFLLQAPQQVNPLWFRAPEEEGKDKWVTILREVGMFLLLSITVEDIRNFWHPEPFVEIELAGTNSSDQKIRVGAQGPGVHSTDVDFSDTLVLPARRSDCLVFCVNVPRPRGGPQVVGVCKFSLSELTIATEKEEWLKAYSSDGSVSGELLISLLLSNDAASGVENKGSGQTSENCPLDISGYLEKQDEHGVWNKKFFAVKGSYLQCYMDSNRQQIQHQWDLESATVKLLCPEATMLWWGSPCCFALETPACELAWLKAENQHERSRWVQVLVQRQSAFRQQIVNPLILPVSEVASHLEAVSSVETQPHFSPMELIKVDSSDAVLSRPSCDVKNLDLGSQSNSGIILCRSLEFQSHTGHWERCVCDINGSELHVRSEGLLSPPCENIDILLAQVNSGAGVQDILPCSTRCFQLKNESGISIWFRLENELQAMQWVDGLIKIKAGEKSLTGNCEPPTDVAPSLRFSEVDIHPGSVGPKHISDDQISIAASPQSNEDIPLQTSPFDVDVTGLDNSPEKKPNDVRWELVVTVENTKDFSSCQNPFLELSFGDHTKRIVDLKSLLEMQQIPPKADADFHDPVSFLVKDKNRALVLVIKDSTKPSKVVGSSKIPIEKLNRNQTVSAWCKVYKRGKKVSAGAVLLSLLLKSA